MFEVHSSQLHTYVCWKILGIHVAHQSSLECELKVFVKQKSNEIVPRVECNRHGYSKKHLVLHIHGANKRWLRKKIHALQQVAT